MKKSVKDPISETVEELDREDLRVFDPDHGVDENGECIEPLRFLAGYVAADGTEYVKFKCREMDGRDEEAINRRDIRSNGAKLCNVICERCITVLMTEDEEKTITRKSAGADWGKIIRSLLTGDLDFAMFQIRRLSKGNEVTFKHKCPQCGNDMVTVADIDADFTLRPFEGEREIRFQLIKGYKDHKGAYHKDGVFKLPDGRVREAVIPLIGQNPASAMTKLLSLSLTFDSGARVTPEGVSTMTLRDRSILEELTRENSFGYDTTLDGITCDSCGYSFKGNLGESDFF